jgi:hypothetical protein
MKASMPSSEAIDNMSPEMPPYKIIRVNLLVRGVTFESLCASNGVSRQFAYQCLTGKRKGPAAHAVVQRLSEASRCA